MKAQIKDLTIGLDGRQILALSTKEDMRPMFDNLKDKVLSVEIKEYRERRSLDANAYAWKLMSKLAEELTAEAQGDIAYSKDDVYLLMLQKYGQGGIVKIRNKDKNNILRELKYWEEHEKLNEENAGYYRIWVGSSNYDSKEMSLFLNGIIADCKELGIQTETPEEIARYEEAWANR